MTGAPVSGAKRLQFNLHMKPIEGVPYLEGIQEIYYPLFWVEEGADMKEEYVKQLQLVLL